MKKTYYIFLLLLLLLKITITGNAQVVINEVMVKSNGTAGGLLGTFDNTSPPGYYYGNEYIEIYNKSCSAIDISGWMLGNATTPLADFTGGCFAFPPNTIIQGFGHIVLGTNRSSADAASIDFKTENYTPTTSPPTTTGNNMNRYQYISFAYSLENTSPPRRNSYWILPNSEGWIGLYDNNGNPQDAIYWTGTQNQITTAAGDNYFNIAVTTPLSASVNTLVSARGIYNLAPTKIAYINSSSIVKGNSVQRVPDGGAWQASGAASINRTTTGNCNGGTCASAGSFTITASLTNPSCGSSNGSATVTPNPAGAYTYTWTAPAVSTTNTATGLSAGPYTVTVGQGGCTTSTVITLTSTGGPTITTTQTLSASCGSSDGSATVTATPGSTFTWSPSGGNLSSATNLAAGNYTVLVSLSGCNTQTVVTIPSASNSTITATQTIATSCGLSTGEATVTSIPAGATYTWSSGVSSTTNTASGLAAGNYTAYVTLAGCTISTVVTISSTGGPTITSTQTNTTTCGLSTGAATVNSTPAGTAYSWSAGVSSTTNTASGLAAGNYTAYVTLAGCTVNTVVTISSAGGPTITSVNTIGEDCNTSNGSATVTASPAGTTYLWAPSGVTTSTINGLASGNYTVTASLGACSTSSVITINPIIKTFTISPDVTILQGNSTAITVSSGYTYTWTPTTNLSCTNCANPIANPSVTTNYCVDASDGVCSYTNCVIVNVEIPCIPPKILSAPNAFSPNGDGNNDEFCIKGLSNCISSFEISIFNRWGEKIYSSTEANFCWDGKYKGVSLDPGVFVYYLKAIYIDNSELTKKGNITLLH